MIRINLMPKARTAALPIILGIDLNYINFKNIILSVVVVFIGQHLIDSYVESTLNTGEQALVALRTELAEYRSKANQEKNIKAEIDKIQEEEKNLLARLDVVKSVMQNKQNPWRILYFISNKIPSEVWINNLKIKSGVIEIEGESSSYKSIGIFLDELQNSTFFEQGMPKLSGSETIENKEFDVRTQTYKITGKINRYEVNLPE